MNRKITFAELCRLFDGLNFERIVQPTHVLFEHAPSDTKVVLRSYQARDLVNSADLAVVRKTLDERGMMSADSFEHFLKKKPA